MVWPNTNTHRLATFWRISAGSGLSVDVIESMKIIQSWRL